MLVSKILQSQHHFCGLLNQGCCHGPANRIKTSHIYPTLGPVACAPNTSNGHWNEEDSRDACQNSAILNPYICTPLFLKCRGLPEVCPRSLRIQRASKEPSAVPSSKHDPTMEHTNHCYRSDGSRCTLYFSTSDLVVPTWNTFGSMSKLSCTHHDNIFVY